MSTINVNVGVLGHVDSGKTSLCKAMSQVLSTACFDKNPQSQQRGITLDLGFSSYTVDIPEEMDSEHEKMQVTLVDCPGHASLIRTIIGGAQILDLVMLVIDVTKGIQTQTAECLVVGEITCDKMLIVLNKIDLIPEAKREAHCAKMSAMMEKALSRTKFKNGKTNMMFVSAAENINIAELTKTITLEVGIPLRNSDDPFLFAVDHCFGIKGQGTVMTGTVLSGTASVNDVLEVPSLKMTRKLKSIQKFHKPVQTICQGDRAGVCVAQFDSKLFERGYLCKENLLQNVYGFICNVNKIKFHKSAIKSGQSFHVTIGHDTVMAKVDFFVPREREEKEFSFNSEYRYVEELTVELKDLAIFAMFKFDSIVNCPEEAIYIASRFDTDIGTKTCRLAFHGRAISLFSKADFEKTVLPSVLVYKTKVKTGVIEKANDPRNLIGRGMFKKETDMALFTNLKVTLSTGHLGVIEGAFGKSGKFRVGLRSPLSDTEIEAYNLSGKKKGGGPTTTTDQLLVTLEFRRYIYDSDKKWKQRI